LNETCTSVQQHIFTIGEILIEKIFCRSSTCLSCC